MLETTKVRLKLLVQGTGTISSQLCEKNSKKYKQKLIAQVINISEESYKYMLENPANPKLKKIWKQFPEELRLKKHFDLVAHDLKAVTYKFEILE